LLIALVLAACGGGGSPSTSSSSAAPAAPEGEGEGLSQDAFSRLVVRTGVAIRKNGHELTTLTAKPSC